MSADKKKEEEKTSLIPLTDLTEQLNNIKQAFLENMEGLDVSIDMVTVPMGGKKKWEIPSVDGEELVEEIRGVIIGHHIARGYWNGPFGGNQAPDCFSMDGIDGIGDPGGKCIICPNDKWGTKHNPDGTLGRGKACAERQRIFILRYQEEEGMDLVPLIVSLPPTSRKPFGAYMTKMSMQGIRYWHAITELALETATNRGNITYSRLTAKMIQKLDEKSIGVAEGLKKNLTPILRNKPIIAEKEHQEGEPF